MIKSKEYYDKFGSDVVDKFVHSTGVSQRNVCVPRIYLWLIYWCQSSSKCSVKESNVIISGFGVGLSLGITSFLMDGKQCLPIIRVKEGWDDGVL